MISQLEVSRAGRGGVGVCLNIPMDLLYSLGVVVGDRVKVVVRDGVIKVMPVRYRDGSGRRKRDGDGKGAVDAGGIG